jgi:Putative peptidoglycan binding domain/LysM domain
MSICHVVKQGECLASIAAEYGMAWNDVWNSAENQGLRALRRSPHVLFPGDEVVIPERMARVESRETDATHRFRKKGTAVRLRLQLLDHDIPRSGEPYVLKVNVLEFHGKTDSDGRLEHVVPPEARQAVLRMGGFNTGEDYVLKIGALDPVTEITGVQSRLSNLGFACGPVDGILGPRTRKALAEFQRSHQLKPTGEPDSPTQSQLVKRHGS